MNTTRWLTVPEYHGLYEINEQGQVRSLHKRYHQMILNQRIDRAGYYTVRLSKIGKVATYYVHRLLALAFMPNPELKRFINHKDLNKLNNHLSNLEWVTHQENMIHAFKNGAIKVRKGKNHPRSQPLLFKTTGEEFYTMKEAAKQAGKNYKTFTAHLRTNKNSNYRKLNKDN